MKITKKDMPLIMHGVLVVALFCLLVLSVVILLNNSSVAWFAQNKKVDANGMSVSLKDFGITDKYYAKYNKHGTQTEYEEITSWKHLFDNLWPGDTVSIKVEYTGTEDQLRNLKVSFKALDEKPLEKTVDGQTRYFYFGSQLRIIAINGVEQTDGPFLVTPSANKIYYEAQTTPNEIELARFENMAKGTTYTLEFTVQFVNYPDVDQNDYQGFDKPIPATDPSTGDPQDPPESCLWQLVGIVEE